MVPRTPSKTSNADAAMYAQPKKAFLPPVQAMVEITIDLVPPNDSTG